MEPDIKGDGLVSRFIARHSAEILDMLLKDRTTGRNIIWADDEYAYLGDGYTGSDEITVERITGANAGLIRTRIEKERGHQAARTRARAEVFTPSWLCNRMNNYMDADWFGHTNVFNTESGQSWETNPEPVAFPKTRGKGWHAYVSSTRLEITCGEAPFLCSRYDAASGETIPVSDRIGILDRKLRVVSEKCRTRATWMTWAFNALKATYGFEYQGDNLLIARINMFETLCEHLNARWNDDATEVEKAETARIVSWNIWQMDGLTDAVPTKAEHAEYRSTLNSSTMEECVQGLLFGEPNTDENATTKVPLCIIYDWENNEPYEYATLKGKVARS